MRQEKKPAAKPAAAKPAEKPRRFRRRQEKHRHGLGEQIEAPENNGVRVYPRGGKRKRNDQEEETNEALTAKMTGRILKAAREQQDELEAEEQDAILGKGLGRHLESGALAAALRQQADSSDDDDDDSDGEGMLGRGRGGDVKMKGAARPKVKGLPGGDDDDDNDDALDAELRARTLASGAGDEVPQGDDLLEEEEVSPEDEAALQAFMAPGAETFKQQSLGDLILQKLREKQQEKGLDVLPQEGEEPVPDGLDEKVMAVYKGVGKLLSRFTVGKVPKAFKIIPNLKNWEEVLWLTEPDFWSPHAMYEATKMFVSNLNARLAQRFLALVLLPRIRREIREKQKLHFALFMALKKATYKPGAFYKGILLPLCVTRTCTLREAVVLTSVLKRASIPVLHSAAAIMRMADMEYCGTTSFFMRVLLDKKYALPYRVIDGLVDHFVRFADDERAMPVVWHQTLLCFVQRYKVTPEVLRELDHGRGRGVPGAKIAAVGAGWGSGFGVGSGFGAGATFTLGVGTGQGVRRVGAAAFAAQTQIAVIGKNVSENVRSMPPVMMLEDD